MSSTKLKTGDLKTVRADTRGRITLGSIATLKNFTVRVAEDGEIVLTPVVQIPEREAWFWKNAEYVAAARRGLEDAAAGRVHEVAFAQYADMEID